MSALTFAAAKFEQGAAPTAQNAADKGDALFIKTTTITTALATLLAFSAPVMAGEADFQGSQWNKGQHADV